MRIKSNKAWHNLSNVDKFHGENLGTCTYWTCSICSINTPITSHLVSLLIWLSSVQTGKCRMKEKNGFGRPLLPSSVFDYFQNSWFSIHLQLWRPSVLSRNYLNSNEWWKFEELPASQSICMLCSVQMLIDGISFFPF